MRERSTGFWPASTVGMRCASSDFIGSEIIAAVAAVNSLIGPGLSNFDLSLFKNNYIKRISDSFNILFRAEFFNVLNHPNFSPPVVNNDLYAANRAAVTTAGLITTTSTSSRQLQFALKIIW
jgi:hypothetical protein